MYVHSVSTFDLDMSHMGEAYASQFCGATRKEVLVVGAKHHSSEEVCALVASEVEGCAFSHIWSTLKGAAVVQVLDF